MHRKYTHEVLGSQDTTGFFLPTQDASLPLPWLPSLNPQKPLNPENASTNPPSPPKPKRLNSELPATPFQEAAAAHLVGQLGALANAILRKQEEFKNRVAELGQVTPASRAASATTSTAPSAASTTVSTTVSTNSGNVTSLAIRFLGPCVLLLGGS